MGVLLAIGGLMPLYTQGRGAAQEAPAPDLPYQSDAPSPNQSFLLYGGAYQKVDAGQGVCVGQCAVANALTGDCTCPAGTPPSCRHAFCSMRRAARVGPSCTCVPNNRARGPMVCRISLQVIAFLRLPGLMRAVEYHLSCPHVRERTIG